MAEAEQYLSPKQVSDRYNNKVSVRTLANWRSANTGGPPFTKLGGKVVYPLSRLIEWENKRTVCGTAEYRK